MKKNKTELSLTFKYRNKNENEDVSRGSLRTEKIYCLSLAKRIPKLPSRVNLSPKELVDLFDEYPVLLKMHKFLRLQ